MLLSFSTVQASYAPYIAPVTSKIDPGACVNVKDELGVESCIKEVFKNDYKVAIAVAQAESRLNHDAVGYNKRNGVVWSKDCGIFQINDYYHDRACEMTIEENIRYAYLLYVKNGWQPWSAYKNGSYLRFL